MPVIVHAAFDDHADKVRADAYAFRAYRRKRAWTIKNAERVREYNRKWREKNAAKLKEYNAQYYSKNKKKMNANSLVRYYRNYEKRRAYLNEKQRARRLCEAGR